MSCSFFTPSRLDLFLFVLTFSPAVLDDVDGNCINTDEALLSRAGLFLLVFNDVFEGFMRWDNVKQWEAEEVYDFWNSRSTNSTSPFILSASDTVLDTTVDTLQRSKD